jgi:hypothetical protein
MDQLKRCLTFAQFAMPAKAQKQDSALLAPNLTVRMNPEKIDGDLSLVLKLAAFLKQAGCTRVETVQIQSTAKKNINDFTHTYRFLTSDSAEIPVVFSFLNSDIVFPTTSDGRKGQLNAKGLSFGRSTFPCIVGIQTQGYFELLSSPKPDQKLAILATFKEYISVVDGHVMSVQS